MVIPSFIQPPICMHHVQPKQISSSRNFRVVYRVRQALIGFPAWTPRIHARVAVVRPKDEPGSDIVAALHDELVIDTESNHGTLESKKCVAVLVDFVPERPREIWTTVRMAFGMAVDGVIRVKTFAWPPRPGSGLAFHHAGSSWKSDAELMRFLNEYPSKISLVRNDCRTFEERCLRFLLDRSDSQCHDETCEI